MELGCSKNKKMNIQVLGFVLVGGVFAIGLLVILIYMIFDKTPSGNTTPKPPITLKNKKRWKKLLVLYIVMWAKLNSFFVGIKKES